MAGRIRTIKPEWLEDELMSESSPAARVLSVALILLADDYGRGRGKRSRLIKTVFPCHPKDGAKGFDELLETGFFALYEKRGQTYYQIRRWSDHQKVNHPGKPRIPPPPETLFNFQETLLNPKEILCGDRRPVPSTSTVDHDQERDLVTEFAHAGISLLNKLTRKGFQLGGKLTLENSRKLIAAGYTPDQARAVVEAKFREWSRDERMRPQLKPSVLFRPSNFAKYVEEDLATATRYIDPLDQPNSEPELKP